MPQPIDPAGYADDHAHRGLNGDYGDHEHRMRLLAYAQVYATLAVAAATDRQTAVFRELVELENQPRPTVEHVSPVMRDVLDMLATDRAGIPDPRDFGPRPRDPQ